MSSDRKSPFAAVDILDDDADSAGGSIKRMPGFQTPETQEGNGM
jgi:hypothetical protein